MTVPLQFDEYLVIFLDRPIYTAYFTGFVLVLSSYDKTCHHANWTISVNKHSFKSRVRVRCTDNNNNNNNNENIYIAQNK